MREQLVVEERKKADALKQKKKSKTENKASRENFRKLMKSRGIEVAESSDEEETPKNDLNTILGSNLLSPRQTRNQAPTI